MTKTILITGSTDGIGLETAKLLLEKGHKVLLHGRNPEKLEAVKVSLSNLGSVESYVADLSDMDAVKSLAKAIIDQHAKLDVLINNAGVFHVPNAVTAEGLDVRFVVKEGFGVEGKDLGIGADILARAALSDEFIDATGKYFDNDSQRFANPHAAGMDINKCNNIIGAIEKILGV